jgi:hypothetical protein
MRAVVSLLEERSTRRAHEAHRALALFVVDRRCRVLYIDLGKVACRCCVRLCYRSQSLDQADLALHVMGKIARDPQAELDLQQAAGHTPSRYNRLAERFEHQATSGR